MSAEQALSLQLAGVTLALRLAIANVQQAVDRVETKVDDLKVIIESEQIGDILGGHRYIRRLADQVSAGGQLPEADWDAVADLGPSTVIELERIRAYVGTRLRKGEHKDPDDLLREMDGLKLRLALLLIAEEAGR